MKTTIGGDRLGSGNKQKVSMRNYERSTHDLSYLWRSSMSAGTLVPFMSKVALPGDSFDIDLNCEVLTLPTIGPLFGSFKVQLDVFQAPIRLYNAALHMNKLGIGMDMAQVQLPILKIPANADLEGPNDPNRQVNPSSLYKYLGISGIGALVNNGFNQRSFNGIPFLAYWEIYKNYYANKQEERGFSIHTDTTSYLAKQEVKSALLYKNDILIGDCNISVQSFTAGTGTYKIVVQFGEGAAQVRAEDVLCLSNGVGATLANVFLGQANGWSDEDFTLTLQTTPVNSTDTLILDPLNQLVVPIEGLTQGSPSLKEFPLENIDKMREAILQAPTTAPFVIATDIDVAPYNYVKDFITINSEPNYSVQFSQENLGVKTYQSDLFNNWISTEWIDGPNGINEVTAVDTTGDSFSIDSLNLAHKVYNMLNRIAISGGSYDDWLDAVYTHERTRSVESPMYLGSLIKELAFDAVISNANAAVTDGEQPLGTLAGRGRLTGKNKGGRIRVKVDEPSYLMGIVSLTPRVDYSQGNNWDVNLKTMNDFHKPALDAIGYQDLVTEQMAWSDTDLTYLAGTETLTFKSAGKQPAWINYMTSVNKTYGNFAIETKEMFMTLNRRYDIDEVTGDITDLTTYIDPTKFNQIFAQTNLDAQNFWVQISNNITARRKMSAKVIPNL